MNYFLTSLPLPSVYTHPLPDDSTSRYLRFINAVFSFILFTVGKQLSALQFVNVAAI